MRVLEDLVLVFWKGTTLVLLYSSFYVGVCSSGGRRLYPTLVRPTLSPDHSFANSRVRNHGLSRPRPKPEMVEDRHTSSTLEESGIKNLYVLPSFC